jgi:hypothetical protein
MQSTISGAAQSATNTTPFRFALYGQIENFEWKESDDGDQLLKESGPLAGIGANADIDSRSGFHLEGLSEVLLGRVDYDGATQSGIPVDSETKYLMFLAQADILIPLNVTSSFVIGPYAGAGARLWRREIEDEGDALGYVEDWSSYYGMIGIRATAKVTRPIELFGRIAVKMPFYNRVQYDFSNLGGPDDVDVEPGEEASPYIEAGVTIGHFTLAGFYEEMKFSESDKTDIGSDIQVWQPESEATMFGLRAGLTF